MENRTPLTIVTGPLGSGKTTLLRHVLDSVETKIAFLVNEFGELAIDSRIVEGKNVRIAELAGGCVCCSLLGEFEAAVAEILGTVRPDMMIVETTGVAEPDALVFDIEEEIPDTRLDGVVTLGDADALVRFPQLGRATRAQIEAGDIILLNKADLVRPEAIHGQRERLAALNPSAPIVVTEQCRVDPDLLFGIGRQKGLTPPRHLHQPEFASFDFRSSRPLDRACFERLSDFLGNSIYRSKGFVCFAEGSYLFNFVGGRWQLDAFPAERTELVFIGERALAMKEGILAALECCQR